ncbi:MAG: hypothetical protein GX297_06355 [Treponema sp.]|nr:hypothetical protein [Treponema sp.]
MHDCDNPNTGYSFGQTGGLCRFGAFIKRLSVSLSLVPREVMYHGKSSISTT